MSDISIAQYYHQQTKYDPETIAAKNRGLDWARQPSPYKEYPLGKSYDLKPYLQDPQSDELGQRLSRLLLLTYGLTAKIPTLSATPLYLRSAPSAGGLYPAEVYLISRGTNLLPAGLYNYQVLNHTLLQFWNNSGDHDGWQKLQAATFAHPLLEIVDMVVVISAVFYRSAWRYEDRAYRRIFLDTGHLLGNLELAGSRSGLRPHLVGGFVDQQVNKLLYLNPEQEGVIAIAPLVDQLDQLDQQKYPAPPTNFSALTALPSPKTTHYPPLEPGELLSYLHTQTQIPPQPRPQILRTEETGESPEPTQLDSLDSPNQASQAEQSLQSPQFSQSIDQQSPDKYNFPFCTKISTIAPPLLWPGDELENTILKRRSTRAYTGADLTLEELKTLLDFTYHPAHYQDQNLDPHPDYFDLGLIQTFLAVSGVADLEEGCYYYAPQAQELRQIRFKNFRQELHYLCLGQDLARDAAVLIFHTVNLEQAVAKWGDRAYRYLHMDAGHLGQRLNLGAVHLDLGVSGIGGFFDDRVNDILGIPPEEAVLYITTLGRPRGNSL
jgi:SagB-type dehydrogenase family enzyme